MPCTTSAQVHNCPSVRWLPEGGCFYFLLAIRHPEDCVRCSCVSLVECAYDKVRPIDIIRSWITIELVPARFASSVRSSFLLPTAVYCRSDTEKEARRIETELTAMVLVEVVLVNWSGCSLAGSQSVVGNRANQGLFIITIIKAWQLFGKGGRKGQYCCTNRK